MFRWLLDASLTHRAVVLLLSAVLVIWGALTLSRTPVDVFPDLNQPTVTVMAEAGGMAAEEVEQRITMPLEAAMNGLPGVTAVRSTSSAGLAFVYVSFDWAVDIHRARQMVAERLGVTADTLPAGIVPHMGPVSSIMGEIMQVAIPLSADSGGDGDHAMAAREYADWVLRPRLLAIPGVAQVIPLGGAVRQFAVWPDTQRMAALGITLAELQAALQGFAGNTSGGFLARNGREYLIRHLGHTIRLDDLQRTAVATRNGQVIRLDQVAQVGYAPAPRRGDAGLDGQPAVILGIHKQPAADTLQLTAAIESALQELRSGLPEGMSAPRVTFRQASFIEASIDTLQGKLIGAAVLVAVVLFVFLGTARPTLIALTAIPVSVCTAVLVFRYFGLSINTMTLGGLAIAIGGLVDDAVVDVENILRRLRQPAAPDGAARPSTLAIVRAASMEVRSGILYATAIIVLVFVPLFALPGIEGRLFVPLGVAFIVSTLASLLVSVTLTPVLASWLLPRTASGHHGDTRVLAWLKARYRVALVWALARPRRVIGASALAVVAAAASVPWFPTTFLPPFNEGTLLVGLRLNPGVTLAESVALARQAEHLVMTVPEVVYVGRRSGRAELDEHAEGVHVSELDIGLQPAAELTRSMAEIQADIRAKLAVLPGSISMGQPLSHRIDHMLSGVRAQIAIKVHGDDLDALRAQAQRLRERLAGIPGLVDLEIEKQVLSPQIKVHVDHAAVARHGLSSGQLLNTLNSLVEGSEVAQVMDGPRRFAVVMRLTDGDRAPDRLAQLRIDTPMGRVPLSALAQIEVGDGPNQISRDDGIRRIVLTGSAQGRALSEVVADIRAVLADTPMPSGLFTSLGGQFQAQEAASRLIGALSLVSLALMGAVLHMRYPSVRLCALIMVNIPLALVGAVAGLWLSGQPLSVAALIGFVTLAGIAVRNGILKVSHYLNLMRLEGEAFSQAMVVRGSLERLSPVLMTALVTAIALAPLLFEAERPGTEILHPVAVVIFSGLVGATLLDTFLTPVLFWRYGREAAERLAQRAQQNASDDARPAEAF
ncbi:CusA/CzcA family heavy metal efflux RND transporter [Aquabacterium fontiphilum]|uniref:efflux RND transporter permease subunit n=1 Tax=Aquabacterium fontiphilum TaxID=450365 RepID=UPI0013779611|nr:efflux RND transporter permease subunit [Aquabacterium fontiphilum]NBD21158.1 CusA/CzcA family heavy metal efflux RND transporter [Aquabacterium fontiphilum]